VPHLHLTGRASLFVALSFTALIGVAVIADHTAAQSASPSGATATPGSGSLTDASGDVWAVMSGGTITENGTAVPSSNVILILYYNTTIYQNTSNGTGWWQLSASGGSTHVSGDPRGTNPCTNYYTCSCSKMYLALELGDG
jgi:hypothetical protein